MSKRTWLSGLMFALIFVVATASVAAATPKPLSSAFSKNGTECGLWWFDKQGEMVWLAGERHKLEPKSGGFILTCHFTIDFTSPDLMSREEFCSIADFAFMCKGNGALVDNRTTCNLDEEVHNGTVVAGPSGGGQFTCHVK